MRESLPASECIAGHSDPVFHLYTGRPTFYLHYDGLRIVDGLFTEVSYREVLESIDRYDVRYVVVEPETVVAGGQVVPNQVAMHLIHSVGADTLQGGRDVALVRHYHAALVALLPTEAAAAYSFEVAWQHFRLAVLDYTRHLLNFFVTDSSAEVFAAKERAPRAMNTGMLYRDPCVCLYLVERADTYLAEIEASTSELFYAS